MFKAKLNKCSLASERGRSKKWRKKQRVEFLKEIEVVCLRLCSYVLPLLHHYWEHRKMPVYEGVSEGLQQLYLCGAVCHAAAMSVEPGWSAGSRCFSALKCNSKTVPRWVSPDQWLCHPLVPPLCHWPHPARRLGNSSILAVDVVSYQKHSCLSCGLLVLAFNLFKLALGLPLSLGICYLMSSPLLHPQLLCDSNPLPSPPTFACMWAAMLTLPEARILFFSSPPFHPHLLKGSGTWQQLFLPPRSFIRRASLPMRSCWRSWEERPSVSAMTVIFQED